MKPKSSWTAPTQGPRRMLTCLLSPSGSSGAWFWEPPSRYSCSSRHLLLLSLRKNTIARMVLVMTVALAVTVQSEWWWWSYRWAQGCDIYSHEC